MNQIVQEQIILSSGCKILADFLVPHEINGWIFNKMYKFEFIQTSFALFFQGGTRKPAMIPTNLWPFLFCQDFTMNTFSSRRRTINLRTLLQDWFKPLIVKKLFETRFCPGLIWSLICLFQVANKELYWNRSPFWY